MENMRNLLNVRSERELYPDYTAELEELNNHGLTVDLLHKIIHKHRENSLYNKKLYKRYEAVKEGVAIFKRKPRYSDEPDAINNHIANDFFSEIVDFKTGYFAGTPVKYGYSQTEEAEKVTGGKEAVKRASKMISDFTVRSNMFDVDMETTKFASIYGYSGRLMYIDLEGNERIMPVHGYETIILSSTNISEPEYAVRYYQTKTLAGTKIWNVEFYDDTYIHYYRGSLSNLSTAGIANPVKEHMFDYCPLQGVANNKELIGDAEKVITLIDDYDKNMSDNSNEVEGFVHAMLMFENIQIDDKELAKAQHTGAIRYKSRSTIPGKAYYLTKNINDSFTEHHLERTKNNIYRFSKTPNLSDETFGAASGVSLKFKLHGLETKCGMFEAKMISADTYMFKCLASSWRKHGEKIDYLQCTMEFTRNFPLDELQEAQTAQARLNAKLPQRWVYDKMPSVDDANYIMDLIEAEKDDIPPFDEEDTDEKISNETDDEQNKQNSPPQSADKPGEV